MGYKVLWIFWVYSKTKVNFNSTKRNNNTSVSALFTYIATKFAVTVSIQIIWSAWEPERPQSKGDSCRKICALEPMACGQGKWDAVTACSLRLLLRSWSPTEGAWERRFPGKSAFCFLDHQKKPLNECALHFPSLGSIQSILERFPLHN